jgi:hypothetical protein
LATAGLFATGICYRIDPEETLLEELGLGPERLARQIDVASKFSPEFANSMKRAQTLAKRRRRVRRLGETPALSTAVEER